MNKKKTYHFKSETSKLLDIMINSLYSNKEIFLRELISNASDALEKLRFEFLYKKESFSEDYFQEELAIHIIFDIENCELIIRDNGIGLKYEEAITLIGTIAKSGTKEFLEQIQKNYKKDKNTDISTLIGNFGVGFYSCFIVSKKVKVFSRSVFEKETKGILWESEGKDNYILSYKSKNNRGTDVILKLKPTEKYLLENNYLTNLIKKYSNFIKFPIYINQYNNQNKNFDCVKINEEHIFWEKNKKDLKNIDYKDFYKKISDNVDEPLAWAHHKVEGKVNYIMLIYLPQYKIHMSIYESVEKIRKQKIKFFIKNIFINDNIKILPNYLKFIEGVVDAEDLPLNVSREIIQNSNIINTIQNNLVNKIIGMLENLSLNKPVIYAKFWNNLGFFLKEGIIEDKKNKNRLISLLRFKSSKSGNDIISLDEYIKRMAKYQYKIYYISGLNINLVHNNPNLEIFIKNDIEVLYLFDRIDEWVINYINNYNGKNFQSLSTLDDKLIIKELKLTDINIKKIQIQSLLEKIEYNLIKIQKLPIKNIEFTNLLINYVSSLVVSNENNLTTNMSKLLIETGHDSPKLIYILRLNINHPIIKYLINKHNTLDKDSLNEWFILLYEEALLTEQGYLDKYNEFISRINRLLTFNLLIN